MITVSTWPLQNTNHRVNAVPAAGGRLPAPRPAARCRPPQAGLRRGPVAGLRRGPVAGLRRGPEAGLRRSPQALVNA